MCVLVDEEEEEEGGEWGLDTTRNWRGGRGGLTHGFTFLSAPLLLVVVFNFAVACVTLSKYCACVCLDESDTEDFIRLRELGYYNVINVVHVCKILSLFV